MITKYSPPRKTPNLYSDELYNEICDDLKVKESEQKLYFKETIERAAVSLLESKQRNKDRLTDSQEKSELLRLANSLQKSQKIFNSLFAPSQMTRFRVFTSIKPKKTKREEENEKILREIFGQYHANPDAINLALKALEETFRDAQKHYYSFGKENKTNLVLQWLWYFSDDWVEISNIRFAKNQDYDSPSLRVLKKLIKPINSLLIEEDKITESMLEQAVIKHKKYKDKHPQEFQNTELID